MWEENLCDSHLYYPAIGLSRHRLKTDGIGVTTLVASYGCTLRCRFCLNPQCFRKDTKITYLSVEDLFMRTKIDDLYFQATGGGITFGGGEPLLQAEFLQNFCKRKPEGWKINLETALNVPEKKLRLVLPFIDQYIVDVKDMDPVIYERYTKVSNAHVLRNLDILAEDIKMDKVMIRLPYIPGYNSQESIRKSEKQLREKGFLYFDHFTYKTGE